MTKHIPVEGKSGFYRDSDSTAIINKDKKAYIAYMERKKVVENKNTGLPDLNVPASVGDEFLEYTFNSREIPKFTAFQIKVVMVGDNQAKPPRIKELRGIAFA